MFNIIQFYKDFNIQYSENSKNTNIGWVNIKCPFCNDHSDHLGFNIEEGYFNCWICEYHSIYEVIKKLIPFENVNEIIKKYDNIYSLQSSIKEKIKYYNSTIIIPGYKLQECHKLYLIKRGLDPDYIEEKYKLKGTLIDNKYSYRIIIPIYFNNQVVSYQTRGISEGTKYINCFPENEIIPIKETLYNLDNCKKDFIVVTEGCFKIFKLGDNSCATFGKNIESKQIQLLSKYKKVFIYFDPDPAGNQGALKLSSLLSSLGIETYIIKNDTAPDNLTQKQVKEFWLNLSHFL